MKNILTKFMTVLFACLMTASTAALSGCEEKKANAPDKGGVEVDAPGVDVDVKAKDKNKDKDKTDVDVDVD